MTVPHRITVLILAGLAGLIAQLGNHAVATAPTWLMVVAIVAMGILTALAVWGGIRIAQDWDRRRRQSQAVLREHHDQVANARRREAQK